MIAVVGLSFKFLQWVFTPTPKPATPPSQPYYPSYPGGFPPIGNVPLTCWCSYAGPIYNNPPPSNPPPPTAPYPPPPPSNPIPPPSTPNSSVPKPIPTPRPFVVESMDHESLFQVEWIPIKN